MEFSIRLKQVESQCISSLHCYGHCRSSSPKFVRRIEGIGRRLRRCDHYTRSANRAHLRRNVEIRGSRHVPLQRHLCPCGNGSCTCREGGDVGRCASRQVSLRVDRIHRHHFEIGRRNLIQVVQVVVVPAIVRRSADEHI